MVVDFYTILGVSQTASSDQIRKRFLELAKDKHPDRFTGRAKQTAEEEFQALTQAFNNLHDPMRRRNHDEDLRQGITFTEQKIQDTAKAFMIRGVKAYREKKFLDAAENFRQATQANPRLAKAWHHLAMTCMQEKRWLRQAAEAIEEACKLAPMKVSYLILAGKINIAARQPERAEYYLEKALEWGGDDPEIHDALESIRKPQQKSRWSGFFGKI